MKKNSLFFIFFTLFLSFSLSNFFCEEINSGYEECKSLSNFITDLKFNPIETPIINSDSNDFPFNLSIEFKKNTNIVTKDQKKDAEQLTDFIISFTTEDIIKRKDFLSLLLKKIELTERNCNVYIVFTYGDIPKLNIPSQITGIETYIDSLTNKNNISAVCVKYTVGKTFIIPGGAYNSTPSWLTEIIANAFFETNIPYKLKGGFISSLYRLNLMQNDSRTSQFLKSEIPAAGIEINSNKINLEKQCDFFIKMIELYNPLDTTEWDKHTNQFILGNKILWISENVTIVLFLVVAFFSLLVLTEFSFVIKTSKKDIRKDVKNLWYLIPLTVLATTVAFLIGQSIASFLYKIFSIDNFTKLAVKLFTGFLFTSIYFLLIIKIQGLLISNAYSYFVTIVGVLNIFIFSFIDISLFYLFVAEYIIIYFSRLVKNSYTLILFFFIMLLPFIPYSIQIIKYISPTALPLIINGSFLMNIIIAFAFLPFEFIWLRILTRLNKKWKESDINTKKFLKQNIIAISSAVGLFTTILITVSFLIPEKYKSIPQITEKTKIITENDTNMINVSYNDYNYFGETARIIYISMKEQSEACTVTLVGENSNPILYSDNIFYYDNKNNSDTFRITSFPPKELTFSYIANNSTNAKLSISIYIPKKPIDSEEKSTTAEYKLYQKDIYIPKINGKKQ